MIRYKALMKLTEKTRRKQLRSRKLLAKTRNKKNPNPNDSKLKTEKGHIKDQHKQQLRDANWADLGYGNDLNTLFVRLFLDR